MQPILVQWGGWSISSYAAFMSLGLIAALAVVAIEARSRRIPSGLWLDAALAAITVGVVAARLGYAALNWTYFQDHPTEVLEIWKGGLSWHAGLIGGAIGAWLIAHRSTDHSPGQILDVLAIAAPLGIALGWIGCYLSAAAYGRELFPGEPFFFLAVDQPDLYGIVNPRWPSQLLGAAWSLIIFGVLWLASRRRWPAGALLGLFVASYSCGSLLISFTRGNEVPLIGGWRIDQLFDAALIGAGLFQLWRTARLSRRVSPSTS